MLTRCTRCLPSSRTRFLHTSPSLLARPPPLFRPGPPKLPKAEQEEFDAAVKAAQTVGATPAATGGSATAEELLQHRDLRKRPKDEFEGDVNPKTGETGGPKRDPLALGGADWQYGGRVTDF